MDYHGFHSAGFQVNEHLERRSREASAERLARRISGPTHTRTRTLARRVASLIHRDTRPARVRPES